MIDRWVERLYFQSSIWPVFHLLKWQLSNYDREIFTKALGLGRPHTLTQYEVYQKEKKRELVDLTLDSVCGLPKIDLTLEQYRYYYHAQQTTTYNARTGTSMKDVYLQYGTEQDWIP